MHVIAISAVLTEIGTVQGIAVHAFIAHFAVFTESAVGAVV